MRSIIAVLCIIVATTAYAQEYTSRHFHYDTYFDAPVPFSIKATTVDGADTNSWRFCAGGDCAASRGAFVQGWGNDFGGAAAGGGVAVETGIAALNYFSINQAGVNKFALLATLDADDVTVLLGSAATTAPVYSFLGRTADGDDDGRMIFAPGGAASTTRSAIVTIWGNESGQTGDLELYGGNPGGGGVATVDIIAPDSDGSIRLGAGAVAVSWAVEADGDIAGDATNHGNLVFTKAGKGLNYAGSSYANANAVGSTQADAAEMTAAQWQLVLGANGTTGVKFPATSGYTARGVVFIQNISASALKLYADAAGTYINNVAGTTAYSIAAGKTSTCIILDSTHWWCA